MNKLQIVKCTRVALVSSGILTGVFWAIAWMLGSFVGPEVVLKPLWVPSQALHVAGAIFALFAIIGLSGLLGRKLGRLGFAGLVLAGIGTMCFFADGVIALSIFPALANADDRLLTTSGAINRPPVFLTFVAFAVSSMIGYLVLGTAILRARALPATPVCLLMAGAVAANLPPGPVPPMVIALGGIIWSAAMVWIGLILPNDKRPSTLFGQLLRRHSVLTRRHC